MADSVGPNGLGAEGRKLWDGFTGRFGFGPREEVVLAQAARLADTVAGLEAVVEADGLMIAGSMGQDRLHPAIGELRASRVELVRLLGRLALPDAAGEPLTAGQLQGRRAAQVRWDATRKGRHGVAS